MINFKYLSCMLPEDYWLVDDENGTVVSSAEIIIEDLEDLKRGLEICCFSAEELLDYYTDSRETDRLKAELLNCINRNKRFRLTYEDFMNQQLKK